ncbi:MAG: DUF1761 domain-containing protein [Gammaproteobacteria bacterium]|nr:DUF1761 domain-containing protein [Gammaproteobacteria bacterium]MDH3373171.1 DUF1761 domain-containing protein [Gammaproteobacteria bacterium]MDH3410094.1 DUF1761 domain-containing protein [Gammaproteobacteria bacterium]MDH3551429.1 DUF1761 domain-containing protein [Gammaproteobacteria bacterium]
MEINYIAAVAAAVSSFLLGGLWYSPMLFLKPWNKAMGRDENSSQGHPARVFGLSFVFALLSALAFAHILGPAPDFRVALHTGLIVGILFVGASFGINYQFADRPMSALFIDGGYHTGQFVLYAVILGLWH